MNTKHFFLPSVLIIAVLLRFPSLFEPNWYGDEGIYQVIGQTLNQGRFLYSEIWDNKPPLLYLIYGLFNGDQFFVRLTSLFFMIATIGVFYLFAKKLFRNTRQVFVTTSLFSILFATPLFEGNIANAENFMYLPIIAALYIAIETIEAKRIRAFFLAGLLLGIAFLIKIVAVFDLLALLVFLFILFFASERKKWLVTNAYILGGFTIPVVFTGMYFFLNGALPDFLQASFSQNVSYIATGNRLFIGQGLLFLKLLILAVFCFLVFLKRKSLAKEYVFIYIWLFFSLFNALFGGRPWTHYLLTLLPAFCLFVGVFFVDEKRRVWNLALAIILVILVAKNFWVYGKTLSYYANFIQFKMGVKDEYSYREFFDWFVNRDYEVARYIRERSEKDDTIFVWGDNAQIYVLAGRLPVGRYTVAYHVTFYKEAFLETKTAIQNDRPKFIVAARNDFPTELLSDNYMPIKEIRGAKIYIRNF